MTASPPASADPGDPITPFVRAGLARVGLDASAEELAVIEVVDGIYRPHFEALLEADLSAVEAEADFDPRRAP